MTKLRKLEPQHSCADCGRHYRGCKLVDGIPGEDEDCRYTCDDWEAEPLPAPCNLLHPPPGYMAETLSPADLENARKDAQELLGFYMAEWSEEMWCATWLHGLEYELWEDILGELGQLSAKEREKLKSLSNRAGGWFAWSVKDHAPRFVPMDEWLQIYERRQP